MATGGSPAASCAAEVARDADACTFESAEETAARGEEPDESADAPRPAAGARVGAARSLSSTAGSASNGVRPATTSGASPPEREIASSTRPTSDSAVCAEAGGAAGGLPAVDADDTPASGVPTCTAAPPPAGGDTVPVSRLSRRLASSAAATESIPVMIGACSPSPHRCKSAHAALRACAPQPARASVDTGAGVRRNPHYPRYPRAP
ncbi:hypothetical protein BDO18943_05379 [Burkholderia dolosa]|nr:hypothetical protein BDO18943_05379 [Burkholderia dolosa]